MCMILFNATSTTTNYTLSLHDALPICSRADGRRAHGAAQHVCVRTDPQGPLEPGPGPDLGAALEQDRKSTRLNSSHPSISYAVFCLKKKNNRSLSETMRKPFSVSSPYC